MHGHAKHKSTNMHYNNYIHYYIYIHAHSMHACKHSCTRPCTCFPPESCLRHCMCEYNEFNCQTHNRLQERDRCTLKESEVQSTPSALEGGGGSGKRVGLAVGMTATRVM